MKKLILSILLGLYLCTSFASHIIGSEITYESLGNDDYKINLTLYRDCQMIWIGLPPIFDPQSYITVFKGDNSLFSSYPTDTTLVSDLDYQTIEWLPVEVTSPCWIPPTNVCVEKASYQFIVNLPFDSLGYYITYQRCCRQNTVMNVTNPGQTGTTNYIFISKEAQLQQNNSPVFSKNPPVVICKDKANQIDFSAIDIDGDSLVYNFCKPFSGADHINPQPQVTSAPPFPVVNYASGFSPAQPLVGNISINHETGILTTLPTINGLYLIGICVVEYRNGIAIGSIRRDFMINVGDCPSTIHADLYNDSLGQSRDYYINATDTTVSFFNTSGQAQFIIDYLWEFEIDSQTTVTSYLTNPTITFPSNGTYHGKLIVNPSDSTCQDTAFIIVNINLSTRNLYLNKNNTIRIFPNPVKDLLIVEFKKPFIAKKRIEIFDLKGRLIKEVFIYPNQANIQISVEDLSTGNYILKIENQIFKIIKP